MKKLFGLFLVMLFVVALTACNPVKPGGNDKGDVDTTTKSEGVMTYDEFVKAELGSKVVIETFIQARQGWWCDEVRGYTSLYTMDGNGGYFIYNLVVTEEDYKKDLTVGTKIKVTGVKSEWAGEVEVTDATYEVEPEVSYVFDSKDITNALGTANLEAYKNQFVSFKGLTVEAANEEGAAFMYKWNNSGNRGDDLYYYASKDGVTYSFVVESYLCDENTAVYKAIENLQVGDQIDIEGFLYWYNGSQLHTTKVTKNGNANVKPSGTMTYAEYAAAEVGSTVTIETYVQGVQAMWTDPDTGVSTVRLDTADLDGAYFIYDMVVTEATYKQLTVGAKIRVTGEKAEWAGEVELSNAQGFELLEGKYIAPAKDVTAKLDSEDLIKYQNQKVTFAKGTVVANGDGKTWLYKWNGSGSEGDDLYFTVQFGETVYTFCVESDLCGADTEVYKTVKTLQAGDVVTLTGFLYWYYGQQAHITSVSVAK